jgi:hypothetical protein
MRALSRSHRGCQDDAASARPKPITVDQLATQGSAELNLAARATTHQPAAHPLRVGDRAAQRTGRICLRSYYVLAPPSDLQARPVYHRKPGSIEAHLTVVFATLAVGRWIEHQTGWSVREFVKTARRCRTVQIQAGDHVITAADPHPRRPPRSRHTKINNATPERTSLIRLGYYSRDYTTEK